MVNETDSERQAHAVVSVAVLVLLAVGFLSVGLGEQLKWVEYLALMALVPLSYLVFVVGAPPRIIVEKLGAFCARPPVLAICALLPFVQPGGIDFGALLMGGLLGYVWSRPRSITFAAFSALGWQLASRLVRWWSPAHVQAGFPANLVWIPLALALAAIWLRPRRPSSRAVVLALWSLGALGFVYFCGRPYVINNSTLHHQSFFSAPMQLVREGGTLLWDVPSQYGVLGIYLGAILDFGPPWVNFLILNKLFVFVEAMVIFTALARMFPSAPKVVASFAFVACAIFCWVGWIMLVHGPFVFPSSGPFRFAWPPIVLLVVYELSRRPRDRALRWAGNLVWITSLFWSFECFVYVSAPWLGYRLSAAILWNERPVRSAVVALAELFGSLVASVLAFAVIYAARAGHAPDWWAYVEYPLAYAAGGQGAFPMDPGGSVWYMILVYLAGLATVVLAARQKSPWTAFMVAQLGGFWAVCSYFMSRSHPNNFNNVAPQTLLYAASLWFVASKLEIGPNFRRALALAIFPFLFLLVEATATNRFIGTMFPSLGQLDYRRQDFVLAPEVSYEADGIDAIKAFEAWERGLPPGEPAQLAADFPGYFPGETPPAPYWIPVAPAAQYTILSPARQKVYLERFARRARRGGWMVFLESDRGKYAGLVETARMAPFYRLTEVRHFPGLIAQKFEYLP